MGADCCGGSPDAAASQVEALSLNQAAAPEAKPKDTRPWGDLVAEKLPYYKRRVELFEQYKARHVREVEAAKEAGVAIRVILPDGTEKAGVKGATTPFDVANMLSKSLAKKAIVAKVDGAAWDMFRPLECDCALQIVGFDDPEGKEVRRGVGEGRRRRWGQGGRSRC